MNIIKIEKLPSTFSLYPFYNIFQPCVGDISIDSYLIEQRASETCQRLIDNNIINGTEYTASGTIYSSLSM